MQTQLNTLRRHPLFRVLSEGQWTALTEHVDLRAVSAREQLFRIGEAAAAFCFVSEGTLRCSRPSAGGLSSWTVRRGECAAECVLFGQPARYRMSAVAMEPSMLFVINRDIYLQFMHESFDVYRAVLGMLNARLNALRDQVESLTCHSSQVRVARYLLNLLINGNAMRLQLPMQKNEIASWLGLAPETLSRVLRAFRERDLLEVDGKAIIVRNNNALEAIAYQ